MPRSDDLATLVPPGGDDVRLHQGKVITWNPDNGENSVRVGNTILQNLPMLNTGEAIALRNGHVVMVLQDGRSWFIIGRVTLPGSPDFASASVDFAGSGFSAVGFALPTTGLQITADIDVPEWADEAIVLVITDMAVKNTSVGVDFPVIVAIIDQIPGGNTYETAPVGNIVHLNASAHRLVTDPGPIINVGARWYTTNSNWPDDGVNIVNVNAICIFRSVP